MGGELLKLQFLESNDCGRLTIAFKKKKKRKKRTICFLPFSMQRKKKHKILKAQNRNAENETPGRVIYLQTTTLAHSFLTPSHGADDV